MVKRTDPVSKSKDGEGAVAVAIAGPADPIARNRAAGIIPSSAVPTVPAGVQLVEIDVRRQHIEWVPEEQEAELKHAVEELIGHGATLQKDLGDLCPDTSALPATLSRIQELERTCASLRLALEASSQQLEIALSDASVVVKQAGAELDHRVKRIPELGRRYEKVAIYCSAHGRMVQEGKARAKAQSPAEEPQKKG